MNYILKSLRLHKEKGGKLEIKSKFPLKTKEDLAIAYTPGVGAPCQKISQNPQNAYEYSIKKNTIAVITDSSAVLGMGNLGESAGLPVMEGKCLLLKRFANIDAFPICLKSQNTETIIETIKQISPTFGGILLEDISAPRCFEIEDRLSKELDIPVCHDDQHGTAIVVLAGLINALKIVGKKIQNVNIVVNGVGAGGIGVSKLLMEYGAKNFIFCDSKGIIFEGRKNLNPIKTELARKSNPQKIQGTLSDAIKNADIFLGLSKEGILTSKMVSSMKKDSIVFAMANPNPEIMPDKAIKAGAKIVATGRSDFPNQINNVLAFPGLFRGLLDSRAQKITNKMKISAAKAIANLVKNPHTAKIIPSPFNKNVASVVAKAIIS